ncbi:MAG: NAD(P)-dependent oxidoreductase [Candidatus Adiutrix sp.]|jgi:nucleoside-diphosphate-sugar epimerase|nr:NAD(P)-dependent oxidoreductase [Candidatus Adiutrix sp.]
MKVLIFGGAGYLGGQLTPRLLAAGHAVTVFDSLLFGAEALAPHLSNGRFRLIEGDLRDISAVGAAVRGQDAAVLLAALVGEPACDKDPAETVAVNYLGAMNAIKAAVYYRLRRFIFASTDSCYGAQEQVNLTETSPLKPISLYARLKARVEEEFLSLPRPAGFHPTVLRLATLYGLAPRMRFDLILNLLARDAALGRGVRIFSGEQWRPFVHVRDAAAAFLLVLSADPEKVSGQVFNVGADPQNIQFKELAGLLRQVMPEAAIETVPQPPDLRDYHVSFDKIRDVLRFAPEFEPLDGLREIKAAILSGLFGDPFSGPFSGPYDAKYRNS